MKKIGKGSWEQFWLTYKNKPGSLAVLICVILAAAITVGVLFSLIIYILVNGVVHLKPELFAWEYNTSNMSMMPAIISTVYITALSLLMAVPVGIFSAIYLVEYLSLIHISEPTRPISISYAVFCLKKKFF